MKKVKIQTFDEWAKSILAPDRDWFCRGDMEIAWKVAQESILGQMSLQMETLLEKNGNPKIGDK